jgi:DNA-binding PadR family transcriptional regulator
MVVLVATPKAAHGGRDAVKKRRNIKLTTPDLVVLGLLAERAMHGYDVVLELERREVQDWAGVSRPQVYYSLQKLAAAKLIAPARDASSARGPERTVFAPTPAAGAALADALERDEWATQRPPPPFLTWTALSIHARPRALPKLINRRRQFLQQQIAKEKSTLDAVRGDEGPLIRIAEAMIGLTIRQFEVELAWLAELELAIARPH